MIRHLEPIQDRQSLVELISALKNVDLIALDTEFIRETTFFPLLEIIQIATESDSWWIDVQAFRKNGLQDLEPFSEWLSQSPALKIVHAAQGDQECFFVTLKALATPVLDTAQAASVLGYGENIGLKNLLEEFLKVEIAKGHSRTKWSIRPLPEHLIAYALEDVEHLVPLARALILKLDEVGRRDWALSLSKKWENPALYESDPVHLATKMFRGNKVDPKTFWILVELYRWREARVRKVNRPRKWVAEDSLLLDLAVARPLDMKHLESFRALNRGEMRDSGEDILAAIQLGLSLEAQELPEVLRKKRVSSPNDQEQQALDFLKCVVGWFSERHSVAPGLWFGPQGLIQILRNRSEKVDFWVEKGWLSDVAAQMVGKELKRFLDGEIGFRLVQGRLELTDSGDISK